MESPPRSTPPSATTIPCPICRKPVSQSLATYPFCCERCKLVDLGRWIDGTYFEKIDEQRSPEPDGFDLDEP